MDAPKREVDSWRATAQENVEQSRDTEQQCRHAAVWLGRDEGRWEELIPLLVEIEVGRLKAFWIERQTPEWREGFRRYMADR